MKNSRFKQVNSHLHSFDKDKSEEESKLRHARLCMIDSHVQQQHNPPLVLFVIAAGHCGTVQVAFPSWEACPVTVCT